MKSILIVDDELNLAESIGQLLASEGFATRAVAGGTAGLEIMKKNKPDLLILDVIMPVVNGQEVIRQMKENSNLATIPILLMSGSKEPVRSHGLVWNKFIRKPFDMEELLDVVKELI